MTDEKKGCLFVFIVVAIIASFISYKLYMKDQQIRLELDKYQSGCRDGLASKFRDGEWGYEKVTNCK